MANLVGAMCSCLLLPATRTVFVAAEGIELMMLILKQKRRVRTGALKALDFALVRCLPACERLVDVQGLRTLFPLFMGKHKVGMHSRFVLCLTCSTSCSLHDGCDWCSLQLRRTARHALQCMHDCYMTDMTGMHA